MANHPNRSRFTRSDATYATYFVQIGGCDIDRYSKDRGSYVPESRRAKFPALDDATAWVDLHFPLRTPSLLDLELDLVDLAEKFRQRAASSENPDPAGGAVEMAQWFKVNWEEDFDFVLLECPNNVQQKFVYRRTRKGWAVLTENGWALLHAEGVKS